MRKLSKRTTIYFEPELYQALRNSAVIANQTVSAVVDEAVQLLLGEDLDDLKAYAARRGEPEIGFEELLADLAGHES